MRPFCALLVFDSWECKLHSACFRLRRCISSPRARPFLAPFLVVFFCFLSSFVLLPLSPMARWEWTLRRWRRARSRRPAATGHKAMPRTRRASATPASSSSTRRRSPSTKGRRSRNGIIKRYRRRRNIPTRRKRLSRRLSRSLGVAAKPRPLHRWTRPTRPRRSPFSSGAFARQRPTLLPPKHAHPPSFLAPRACHLCDRVSDSS
jgi:hypothetical protein